MSLNTETRAAPTGPAVNLIFYQVEKNQVSAETLEIFQVGKSRNQERRDRTMHGGKRNGAGRPKGAINSRTRAVIEDAEASGEMPIAYMLKVMRDVEAPDLRRDSMAKAAAAYLYPRMGALAESEIGETELSETAAPNGENKTDGGA